LLLTVTLLRVLSGFAVASPSFVPTDLFVVANPNPAVVARRRVLFAGEDPHSATTIIGDPSVNGATLRVSLASGGDECFQLPASGWTRVGRSGGFKYRGTNGAGAAVTASIDREEIGGDFVLKWKLVGTRGPIDVVPHAGNADFALNFTIVNGGEYCAGGSTPSGGTSTDRAYKVRNDPPPATCGVSACSPGAAP
jgi:hypothetical protein